MKWESIGLGRQLDENLDILKIATPYILQAALNINENND